jgi:hypothetical protein
MKTTHRPHRLLPNTLHKLHKKFEGFYARLMHLIMKHALSMATPLPPAAQLVQEFTALPPHKCDVLRHLIAKANTPKQQTNVTAASVGEVWFQTDTNLV